MFLLSDEHNYIGRVFLVYFRYYYMFWLNKNVIIKCQTFLRSYKLKYIDLVYLVFVRYY